MSEQDQQNNSFYFDDFFSSDDDPGIAATIKVKGRLIPLQLRTTLSLQDQTEIQSAAVKKRYTPEGKVVIDGVDETLATCLLVSKVVRQWPFVYKNGERVPITPANVAKFCGEGADQIARIYKIAQDQQEEALDPFDGASEPA